MTLASPKLSPQTQRILDLLLKVHQPLSAYEILDKLRNDGVRSPPTVYRALDKLTASGLVHRVESLNAFVACSRHCTNGKTIRSSFAVCTQCGDVWELNEPAMMLALRKLGETFLAQVDHKILEVSGICHKCHERRERDKRAVKRVSHV